MSARTLCSQIARSSNSAILKRKFFTTHNKKSAQNNKLYNSFQFVNQRASYSQALGALTKDQAHDYVFRLNDEERNILLKTLEQFEIKQDKSKLECE